MYVCSVICSSVLSFQILQGCLKETVYDWPENQAQGEEGGASIQGDSEVAPMKIRHTSIYGIDDLTYINSE